jgi:hypothetical protein
MTEIPTPAYCSIASARNGLLMIAADLDIGY